MQNQAQNQMYNQMQNLQLGPRNQLPQSNQFAQSSHMMPGSGHQYMGGSFQANLGQAIMANSYGPNRPMMPAQQSILVNGPAGYANSNAAPRMGHTLSNQLWQ